MGFGNFTSVEYILAALFKTVYQVQSVIYTCRHNHVRWINHSFWYMVQAIINQQVNGPYKEKMKHAMYVQLVVRGSLFNIALLI